MGAQRRPLILEFDYPFMVRFDATQEFVLVLSNGSPLFLSTAHSHKIQETIKYNTRFAASRRIAHNFCHRKKDFS